MSESNSEQQGSEENQAPEATDARTGDTNVEAEQVVVNNAEDGGGVDNNPEAPEATPEGEDDSSE